MVASVSPVPGERIALRARATAPYLYASTDSSKPDPDDIPETTPEDWLEATEVPDRPPPSRVELLELLRAGQGVTVGELEAALEDGRLSEAEVEEHVPAWSSVRNVLNELNSPMYRAMLDMTSDLVKNVGYVRAIGADVVASAAAAARMARADPAPLLLPVSSPETTALHGVHAEIVRVATLLEATAQQIEASSKLAAVSVANQERQIQESASLRAESVALRQELKAGQRSADRWAKAIHRWTIVLVLLTVAVLLLTGVVAWEALQPADSAQPTQSTHQSSAPSPLTRPTASSTH